MCGKDTQMSHFLSAFSSGLYSRSFRGLAMSNGGSQTWTLKGYQGFSSASIAAVDIARNPTPPRRAKPRVVAYCFIPVSLFTGRLEYAADILRRRRRPSAAASSETVAQLAPIVNSDCSE